MRNPPLILLVDDEEQIRDLYSTKLKMAGFEVVTASNGAEGIKAAKSQKPDLILLDLKMPIMDGAEALAKLREDPETRDLKTVFLTGFGDPNPQAAGVDVKFAKEAGALDYIRKGIDLEELVKKVKGYLGL